MNYCYYHLGRAYLTSEHPYTYMSYGVNCVEVEIDVLTGEVEILRSDILFDCGQRYYSCVLFDTMHVYRN